MKLSLNVYRDLKSEAPTKTYICYRLLLIHSKKAQALKSKVESQTEEEQYESLCDFLEIVFPDFDRADIDYIDPAELATLINSVNNETNNKADNALKK